MAGFYGGLPPTHLVEELRQRYGFTVTEELLDDGRRRLVLEEHRP